MNLRSGQLFGHYEILKLLGSGGMGEVYLARDTRLNREVAVKILPAELAETPELVARFRKEAGLAARLNHPNICTIHEAGQVDDKLYICMEYVEGKTLRDRIAGRPMPLDEVLEISIQIADALDEARKRNIVHRDIKSANIALTQKSFVKVLDFGLAKQLPGIGSDDMSEASTESSVSKSGHVRGTFAYMSPEQALGKAVDHRSDIFSFGVLLYEMLTGRLPFAGDSATAVVDAILHRAPIPVARYNDEAPDELLHVLAKMLQKDPEARYQSVHEVWVDLRNIKNQIARTAASHPIQERSSLPYKTALLMIIAAVVVTAIAIGFLRRKEMKSPEIATRNTLSLAVLPFRYAGDDPTRDYLGLLVTDGLIAGLQQTKGVAVAPYANVRQLSENAPLKEVSHDLGVAWIIRGSVAVKGDETQITPELVSPDGTSAWKQTLSGRTIATLDLARKSLLTALHLQNPSSTREIEQVRTPSVNAYKIYLEARQKHEGWDLQGNLQEAEALYRKALVEDPDFAAAHAGLARVLMDQFHQTHKPELLGLGQEEAQKALGLDANIPEALLAVGVAQLESGHSIEARDAIARALELAPGDDAACRDLAAIYSGLGRNHDAEEFYNHAILLRPNYWLNHYDMGTFQWQSVGNLDAARVHLEKANQLHPEGYAPLVMLGNINLTQGRLEDAEKYFRGALGKEPNTAAYNNLGLVHYYRGHYDLALRNWEAVLKQVPDNPIYEANVADALRQLKHVEQADLHYKEVIRKFRLELKLNSTDDYIRAGLAMALAATAQCREALDQIRGILLRHPDSTDLAAYGAITVSRCGDLNWAKQIVLNSIAADNLLTIRFDPDLEPLRGLPEIQQALVQTKGKR